VIVLNFVFTFSVPGISKLGHIGGFLTGLLAGVAIAGLPSLRRRLSDRTQLTGLAGVLALILVTVVVKTATGSF
jgi:membrane associated rhomboid family serine protease